MYSLCIIIHVMTGLRQGDPEQVVALNEVFRGSEGAEWLMESNCLEES